jgi:CRISPR-associated endonuclease Cas2
MNQNFKENIVKEQKNKSVKRKKRSIDPAKKFEIFARKLTKNILEKSYDGTAMAFIILKAIGEGPMKAFFKPTYYIDDPSDFLGEIEIFRRHQIRERNMRQTIGRLRKYGLIKQDGTNFMFTKKGRILAERILGYKKRIEAEWDGKYRFIIFDIPESERQHRTWLRRELYFLGYKKLQNSVFVSKLSLTEEIVREIKNRDIEKCVNYLLVEHIYDLSDGSNIEI